MPVRARYRGQLMRWYFFRRKNWKIRTGRDSLVDGYRTISLASLLPRLHGHLTFEVARNVGLPAPRSRVVRFFVNAQDKGLYLQEEQIDESLIRRNGRMPGDLFYGEVVVPDQPKLSSDRIYSNPFLWEKRARNNRYPDEHRPYLTELLDHIHDPSLESWDRMYELLDMEEIPIIHLVHT